MLTRPDITRPRPRPNLRGRGQRVRGRGRKVYRYGRVNDSCNYVTYFGYAIKKCQQNKATYKTVVTTTVIVEVPCSSSPRPNIMQVVNESVQLKTFFRPLGLGLGLVPLEAEARPRGLTSLYYQTLFRMIIRHLTVFLADDGCAMTASVVLAGLLRQWTLTQRICLS